MCTDPNCLSTNINWSPSDQGKSFYSEELLHCSGTAIRIATTVKAAIPLQRLFVQSLINTLPRYPCPNVPSNATGALPQQLQIICRALAHSVTSVNNPRKRNQSASPKLSFSWWVLLGSLGPGTQGDSCFGTCYTPAAATGARGKRVGAETQGGHTKPWKCSLQVGFPHGGEEDGRKSLKSDFILPSPWGSLLPICVCQLGSGAGGALGAAPGACQVPRGCGTLVAWCCLPQTWQNLQRRQHQFSSCSSSGRSLSSRQNLWKGSQQTWQYTNCKGEREV